MRPGGYLVMEMGGANSRGAVAAREYGIRLWGVRDATRRILSGQKTSVNGSSGQITLL
jgi:rifampicin phosphotransferase